MPTVQFIASNSTDLRRGQDSQKKFHLAAVTDNSCISAIYFESEAERDDFIASNGIRMGDPAVEVPDSRLSEMGFTPTDLR